MSPSVSFTVTQSQRDELDAYAAEKGFRTASNLIRYATIQHMRRYPMTVRKPLNAPGLYSLTPLVPIRGALRDPVYN